MNKRIILMTILVIIAISALVPMTARAEAPVNAELTFSGESYTVGDPVQLTLSVTHPDGFHVIPPDIGSNWSDFQVYSQSPPITVNNGDGTETTSMVFDVRLFAPGTFTTLPVVVKVSDGMGQLSEVVAEPVDVTIESILVEGDNQLRDIKPQADLPYRNLLPYIIAGLLVAVALGSTVILWRRRKTRLTLEKVDNRLPHEVAFDELDRIESLRLPELGEFKEYYTLVSDCLRVYMEKTYQIPVLECTTSEIRSDLKSTDISPDVARDFIDFLFDCDLVKFSKFTPDVESAYQTLAQGRQIVEATKPVFIEDDSETDESPVDRPSSPGYGPTNRNVEVTA